MLSVIVIVKMEGRDSSSTGERCNPIHSRILIANSGWSRLWFLRLAEDSSRDTVG
jgi:hypothetical protein